MKLRSEVQFKLHSTNHLAFKPTEPISTSNLTSMSVFTLISNNCNSQICHVPVDFHSDRFGPWWRCWSLINLLDQLPADLVAWQEDVCLVTSHTTLQTHQIKHGKIAALRKRKCQTWTFLFIVFTIPPLLTCPSNLQRGNIQRILHHGGGVENDGLRDEGRLDGSRVKQVGVVADFAELHENVYHRHEVPTGQSFTGPVGEKVTKLELEITKIV